MLHLSTICPENQRHSFYVILQTEIKSCAVRFPKQINIFSEYVFYEEQSYIKDEATTTNVASIIM